MYNMNHAGYEIGTAITSAPYSPRLFTSKCTEHIHKLIHFELSNAGSAFKKPLCNMDATFRLRFRKWRRSAAQLFIMCIRWFVYVYLVYLCYFYMFSFLQNAHHNNYYWPINLYIIMIYTTTVSSWAQLRSVLLLFIQPNLILTLLEG